MRRADRAHLAAQRLAEAGVAVGRYRVHGQAVTLYVIGLRDIEAQIRHASPLRRFVLRDLCRTLRVRLPRRSKQAKAAA